MRRPLCLFVLSFACISFLLQTVLNHFDFGFAPPSHAAQGVPPSQATQGVPPSQATQGVQSSWAIQEWDSVNISGQLRKKEEKNGNIIYYLKKVQILKPASEPENNFSNQSNSNSISQLNNQSKNNSSSGARINSGVEDIGVVCYMGEDISAYAGENDNASIGQWLLVSGTVSFYDSAENEGQFDAAAYYEGLGYHFKLYNTKIESRGETYDRLGEWLWGKQQKLREFLQNHMQEENAGILTAMLLGDKTAMDGEIKSLYQKSGIAHVLAISGLHISLLGMLFYKFLRKCLLPLPLCCFIGISTILLYGKMTGFSTSSFRAIGMFILLLIADVWNRSYDLLTAMAFTAFLSFLKAPEVIFEAGFLLSYLAVIGLAVVNPVLKRCFYDCIADNPAIKKWPEGILANVFDSVLASISTQIMIFPILLWFYHEFSFYSLLLNLIVIPCMSVILLSGAAGCVTGISACLIPADRLLNLYEWLCTLSRRLPHSLIVTGRPAVWQMILYYVLILVWLCLAWVKLEGKERLEGTRKPAGAKQRMKRVCPMIPMLCMLLFFIPVHRENRIDFLSVGQGDCACMRDAKGNVVLVDGGSTDVKEAGKYRLIPFLKYHGISYVDVAFVSHAHEDHYSAILELLETGKEEGISVGAVCISAYGRGREAYEVIVTAAQKAGAEVIYIQKGDELSCGKMHFSCLYPAADTMVTDENDASLVLYGEYQGTRENTDADSGSNIGSLSVLFTGDSTMNCDEEVIEELRQRNIDKISLLKVAHHGSRESTGEALLGQISPSVAVISCGRDNSYGHPHEETLERLEGAGCQIWSTAEDGQIMVKNHAASGTVDGIEDEERQLPRPNEEKE